MKNKKEFERGKRHCKGWQLGIYFVKTAIKVSIGNALFKREIRSSPHPNILDHKGKLHLFCHYAEKVREKKKWQDGVFFSNPHTFTPLYFVPSLCHISLFGMKTKTNHSPPLSPPPRPD
jgi:hypothetical protein